MVAVVVVDPPRPDRGTGPAPNPYRSDSYLARIHGISVLLVVPQFLVWTFALVWLVQDRGWSAAVAVPLVVVATVLTVADSWLAFTAVAERSGHTWSGRALGVQDTAQHLAASAVPPVAGVAVATWGYAAAFGLAALFPLLAAPLVPVGQERELG